MYEQVSGIGFNVEDGNSFLTFLEDNSYPLEREQDATEIKNSLTNLRTNRQESLSNDVFPTKPVVDSVLREYADNLRTIAQELDEIATGYHSGTTYDSLRQLSKHIRHIVELV